MQISQSENYARRIFVLHELIVMKAREGVRTTSAGHGIFVSMKIL